MVKEKLREALNSAVGYYNDGLSADEAIVKAASEHDLTVDQTDRVVESFNTAKTINFYDKNASDRTGSFDLASKKAVTLALFGKDKKTEKAEKKDGACKSVKKASVNPDVLSDAFYFSAPDRSLNRKSVFAEKRANYLDFCAKVAEEKWAHGYSDHTLHGMASDALQTIKAAEADIDSALGTIGSYLWSATTKIAEAIARAPYGKQEDLANLFKVACPHKIVVEQVSKFCPILKQATGGAYVRTPVVDTTPVDDLLKEADDIMEAVAQRTVYRQKKAEFQKKEATLKETLLKDPSMTDKVAEVSAIDRLIHAPTKKAEAQKKEQKTEKVANGLIPTGTMKDTVDIFGTVTAPKSMKEENEALRDDARGAILADLLSSDPILQDADPRQVAEVYKSIIASSPRVSLNKEVVRSVLRGAVNSIAFSPNDMKVLTDVDRGINQAYNLSNLDSSMKDSAL